MELRTYYWHDRVLPEWQVSLRERLFRKQSRYFRVGNAGDLLAKDLLEHLYDAKVKNVREGGRRLLCVGSVGHKVREGDVICGIGVKTMKLPRAPATPPVIVGLRGPITCDAFALAGYDVSRVRFLFDPGLLIGELLEGEFPEPAERAIFIPHYRERWLYRSGLPRGVELVDIDASPAKVAIEILQSSLVYASSLHGIIFAHALRRPCVFVKPQTEESLLKYEDYFASVNVPYERPIESIFDARPALAPSSPVDIHVGPDDFSFPSLAELKEYGVAVGD